MDSDTDKDFLEDLVMKRHEQLNQILLEDKLRKIDNLLLNTKPAIASVHDDIEDAMQYMYGLTGITPQMMGTIKT